MSSFYSIPGPAGTIQVGTVTTGTPEEDVEVTNSGTSNAAILNFKIPQGVKGDKGDPGTMSIAGAGTNSAPAISFAGDTDTGINNSNPNELALITGGNPALYVSSTGITSIGGDVTLNDGGSFTTTIQTVTPTANRTISYPDATGTLALVAGSSGQLIWNNAGAYAGLSTFTTDSSGNVTLSGRWTNNRANAADAPPVSITGTWLTTGGTSTTTKPQFLVEPAGTTSTAWSTNGTGFGINAPSGFTGRLLDLQLNGTPRWHVNAAGVVVSTLTAPTAVDTSATVTIANLQGGLLTSTTAAAVSITLPTGTSMDGGFGSTFNDMSFMWSVINTGPNAATVVADTDHTIVGAAAVAAGTSGRFASRRTAANTWVSYRIS